eukprot:1194674-Prorocentrum_minimum.AAC.4
MNATIARRPFFTSLTRMPAEFIPAGSKGKAFTRPFCTEPTPTAGGLKASVALELKVSHDGELDGKLSEVVQLVGLSASGEPVALNTQGGGAQDARNGHHSPATVLELGLRVPGQAVGVDAQTKGVEAIVTGKGAVEVGRGLGTGKPAQLWNIPWRKSLRAKLVRLFGQTTTRVVDPPIKCQKLKINGLRYGNTSLTMGCKSKKGSVNQTATSEAYKRTAAVT